jgi:hypothetical protein
METALITLTTAGADTGSFSLSSNTTGFATTFESGISRASLLAGYTSNLVPVGTTTIRVKSNSVGCSNFVDIAVVGITTSTTTTTTTLPPSNSFLTNYSINDITITFQLYVKNFSGANSTYGLLYATAAPVTILVGGTYGFSTSYPGVYTTNNKRFKLVISAGSTGIVANQTAFYLNSDSATTSVKKFSASSPMATQALDSSTTTPDTVSFIDAYITTTF